MAQIDEWAARIATAHRLGGRHGADAALNEIEAEYGTLKTFEYAILGDKVRALMDAKVKA